ncbi:MAG: 4-hydroxy-tetrahydrodipicolinate synthase [Pseudomonadales bacterium]|nr:4-hydroxy-tetrahydrodipicolinate synthase [Pseudomonadales bacterium]MDG1444528.1 4-hydroxy-tetrahydrodipicolinate synthase [Pseudomonadales bacterium]
MISGSIVAMVTPMLDDGSVDWDRLDTLVEWHVEEGTNGLVPVGTTGESATVSVSEHCQIVRRVVDVVDGRIPVIAGTGANATSEAIELTRAAKEAGADACLLVTPYYNKPTQEGLYLHYKAIAAAVDLPQVLYNVPGRTACDMLPETVARCAEIEQVFAIKEATGDIERTKQILSLCGDSMLVYSGDDETAVDLMLNGASGAISVTANVTPKQCAEICRLAISGDGIAAHKLNEKLMPLHMDLFLESNPIPVKWALAEMGKIGHGIRLPMTQLSDEHHERVRRAMRHADVIS